MAEKKKDKSLLEKVNDYIRKKAEASGKKNRETAKAEPAPAAPAAASTERRSTRDQIRDDRNRAPLNPEDSLEPMSFKGGKGGTGRGSAMDTKARDRRLKGVAI